MTNIHYTFVDEDDERDAAYGREAYSKGAEDAFNGRPMDKHYSSEYLMGYQDTEAEMERVKED